MPNPLARGSPVSLSKATPLTGPELITVRAWNELSPGNVPDTRPVLVATSTARVR